MICVYLAGPITKGNQFDNVHRALVAGKRLRDAGFCVIIPHRAALDELCLGAQDYEKWMDEDFELIRRSDILVRLPGVSSGSDREVALAWERNMPFFLPVDSIPDSPFSPMDSVDQAIEYLKTISTKEPTCQIYRKFLPDGSNPDLRCGKPAHARVDRMHRRDGTIAMFLCQEHYEKNLPTPENASPVIKRRDFLLTQPTP